MTKRYFKMVVFISMLLFLVSCAAQPVKDRRRLPSNPLILILY